MDPAAVLRSALELVPVPNSYCARWWLGSIVALAGLYYAAAHLSGFARLTAFERAWEDTKREKRALLKSEPSSPFV